MSRWESGTPGQPMLIRLPQLYFFVGMWLMARKKIENWIFWIVGDVISVPLYLYKGLAFTSVQYLIFTLIAIYGYLAWKKTLNNTQAAV